ncbi:MAG: 30S ribosomal protein S8 [Armatimonadetes bacterium]|nr:30S ribosomal protein S8 [Armatimonadota bacterium]
MAGVVTDPIADMLARIRNAMQARKDWVEMPASKIKRELARVLKEEGYIQDFQMIDRGPQGVLRVHLRPGPRREHLITGLRRVSRPGLRIYAKHAEIPRVRGGLGTVILSTSRGIMTDRQARQLGVGGEVLCYIW